jgi:multiple sugar transport system ATP-binding protein
MAAVVTKDIRKDFGDVAAVDGVSLSVCDGEFLVLLGPSGCGKTTFLRIIAGLERQTSGDVLINDEIVNDITPRAVASPWCFRLAALSAPDCRQQH